MDLTLPQILSWLRDGALVALLVVTSWTDTRTARIRNVHTFPAMILGLALGAAIGGAQGLLTSALGLATGFGLMFPLFALNVMKAGDAKLLMAIGALVGPAMTARALFASFVLFLPVAVVVLSLKEGWRNMYTALRKIGRFFYTWLHPALSREKLDIQGGIWTPYALVLAVATVVVWQTSFLDPGGLP